MNKEFGQKIFQQVMDIWVKPEIDRRKNLGKIEDNFKINKIQIIFSLNKKNETRFNEEVKAIIEAKANRDVNKGEIVRGKDIDKIENITLIDKDINCGHITLLLFNNNWIISFDARYNKELIQKHIKASKEFYESAKENLEKERLRVFFENAFASAELSAKSVLLSLPDKKILNGRDHKERLDKFQDWANLGNVKIEFSETLSQLSRLRDSARYLFSEDYKKENPAKILTILEEMIKFAEENIK
jgi:uncharacterized protein (UPF0332 family)